MCGPLKSAEEISLTKTLINTRKTLQKGSTFAGRRTIAEELGRGGMTMALLEENPQAVLDDGILPYLPDPVDPRTTKQSVKVKIPGFV